VFGPVPVPSLGKSVYYVSFIDDFSRNTWIYFLRKKSEVFDKFKEFKALVENQTEKKIKVLRTDNGGEFCGNEFEEFCKKCGIARQKTTPYTPQQNGVAERMNKTLMEKARSMLSGARLGQEFWAEAVGTTCYLVNRSPSSALDDKIHTRYGLERNPLFNILECLVVMLMYMFQRKIGVSWIKRLKSVSLLVIKMV
jgi:transposase InsO family protein